MTDKKRILVLTPRFPYPPIGGDRLRIYKICEELAQKFELSLLSMCESEEEMIFPIPPDGIFTRVDRVFHGKIRKILGSLSVLPSNIPLQVGYYRNPTFERSVADLLPSHDAVLAHLIRTGSYVRSHNRTSVLEMTDAISLAYTRIKSHSLSNPLRSIAYAIESNRILNYERSILKNFDLTILTSETDKEFLLGADDTEKVLVCGNGVDTSLMPFDYSPDGKTIVFIGNNTAYHNADAVVFFADHIFPLIKKHHPSAVFKVVGRIDKGLQRKLCRHSGVITTGAVDRVEEFVRNSSVAVCPIRFGSGIQNKMLEYMSFGIPAVTSPIGLEGIGATKGVHVLVAETSNDWVQQVLSIMKQPDRGLAIAKDARKFVEQHHSWNSMINPLAEKLHRILLSTGKTI